MSIKSAYWQLSLQDVGVIAEGLDDLRQCIDIILRTSRGSDPFRPLFGSNIFDWIDKPVTQAIPNIKREIIQALGIWEPRIEVKSIVHDLDEKRLAFNITYKPISEDLTDSVSLYLGGGYIATLPGNVSYIILTAFIPESVPGSRKYNIMFSGSGNQVSPFPPVAGFSDVEDMF